MTSTTAAPTSTTAAARTGFDYAHPGVKAIGTEVAAGDLKGITPDGRNLIVSLADKRYTKKTCEGEAQPVLQLDPLEFGESKRVLLNGAAPYVGDVLRASDGRVAIVERSPTDCRQRRRCTSGPGTAAASSASPTATRRTRWATPAGRLTRPPERWPSATADTVAELGQLDVISDVVWAPTGEALAFMTRPTDRNAPIKNAVYVVDIPSRTLTNITNGDRFDSLHFSPNGEILAWNRWSTRNAANDIMWLRFPRP